MSGFWVQNTSGAVSWPPQGKEWGRRDCRLHGVSGGDALTQQEQRILGEHVSERMSALMHGSSLEVLIRAELSSC